MEREISTLTPFYQDEFGTLYCGDTKEILSQINSPIAQMAISSPPYWALRLYPDAGQLGQEESFKEFIAHLVDYFRVVGDCLDDIGTLWVNLGDTYYGSGKGSGGHSKKQDSNKGSFFKVNKGNRGSELSNPTHFKKLRELPDKCMCMIPERFAISMVDDAHFVLRNDIVWHKPNAMVTSASDRFTVDYESLFFFTKKSSGYRFNQQFEPYLTKMNRWGGDKLEANGISEWDAGTKQTSYRKRNLRPNTKGKNKRSVWSINTQPISGLKHFAKFPEKLLITPILAGSDEGDTVLDPFFGSGTTGVVAEKLNRKWVGIELSEEYCAQAIERILENRKNNGD